MNFGKVSSGSTFLFLCTKWRLHSISINHNIPNGKESIELQVDCKTNHSTLLVGVQCQCWLRNKCHWLTAIRVTRSAFGAYLKIGKMHDTIYRMSIIIFRSPQLRSQLRISKYHYVSYEMKKRTEWCNTIQRKDKIGCLFIHSHMD